MIVSRRIALGWLISGVAGATLACSPSAPPAPAKPDSAPAKTEPAKPAVAAPVQQPAATKAPAAPRKGGVFKMIHPGDVRDFDGHGLWGRSWPIMRQLYNTLVRLNPKLEPQPELAESWKMADDGKSITLQLRPGVKWHSGRELVANDIKLNIERVQEPKTVSQLRPLAQGINGIDIPDPRTVVLRFNRAHLAVFDLLDSMQVVDPAGFATLSTKGAGTGPFKFAEWQPGTVVKLVRNPDYWRQGYPLLDEVEIRAASDAEQMSLALETKTVHMIERPTPRSITRFKRGSDIKLVTVDQWSGAFDMIMNLGRPPFDKAEVRQAINHAVNRPRFVDVVLADGGTVSCLPIPKGAWAWDEELSKRCEFNLDKARELLTKAGVGGGFETSFIVLADSPAQIQLGQILQDDLAKINVKIKVTPLEAPVHEKSLSERNFDFAAHEYGRANKDPDTLFRTTSAWRSTNTYSGFEFPVYQQKIDAASASPDREKRKAAYRDLFDYILQGPATLSVAGRYSVFAHLPNVRDFEFTLDAMPILERTWLDS